MYNSAAGQQNCYGCFTILDSFKKAQQHIYDVLHTIKILQVILSLGRLAFLTVPLLSCEVKLIAVKFFTKAFLNL